MVIKFIHILNFKSYLGGNPYSSTILKKKKKKILLAAKMESDDKAEGICFHFTPIYKSKKSYSTSGV